MRPATLTDRIPPWNSSRAAHPSCSGQLTLHDAVRRGNLQKRPQLLRCLQYGGVNVC
jgi:hypothetical protein